ncbi:uncharacterized protein LOC100113858 isoform X1 [Nasonia vitripennis]|uniref:Uncharacterized protein n=1 Tax=Nasonia vitripennis TaxID=7425 RepID=A0A7M7GBG1_NASVI|nr:uncharacterized protein LOC100113858 isoform X1 [Nasonia vitripennis]
MTLVTEMSKTPARGWLEPKKQTEPHSAKSKPIARVRPVNIVPSMNVVTGPPAYSNATVFLTSTSKPAAPPKAQRTPNNDQPRSSQAHKTSKAAGGPSKSSGNVVKIVNINVINVNNASDKLTKLKLSNESSSSVSCSSRNDVKQKPKASRAHQPQSSQSATRNTPKTAGKTAGVKKNESSGRRQGVVVTQKQSSVCRIISK